MTKKELQALYVEALKKVNDFREVEINEQDDICIKCGEMDFYMHVYDDEPGLIKLHYGTQRRFKDDAEMLKSYRTINKINSTSKIVKLFMADEELGVIVFSAFIIAKTEKEFLQFTIRELHEIFDAIEFYLEEMERE